MRELQSNQNIARTLFVVANAPGSRASQKAVRQRFENGDHTQRSQLQLCGSRLLGEPIRKADGQRLPRARMVDAAAG